MTQTNEDDKIISCSRCRAKYKNTLGNIENYFGYKALGDINRVDIGGCAPVRYKLCIKCREVKNNILIAPGAMNNIRIQMKT